MDRKAEEGKLLVTFNIARKFHRGMPQNVKVYNLFTRNLKAALVLIKQRFYFKSNLFEELRNLKNLKS